MFHQRIGKAKDKGQSNLNQMSVKPEKTKKIPKGHKKKTIGSGICKSVAYMFVILFILVWLNEILDLPHYLLGTIKTPINWGQAIIESILIAGIGIITVLSLIHNINKRREAERGVREERDRAQKYLDVAGVMLVVINANQMVSLVNKKGCEILGYDEQDIIGRNWFEKFIPVPIKQKSIDQFKKMIHKKSGFFEYLESPILNKNSKERMIAWHHTILTDESGNGIGMLSSGEDITQRKMMQEALKERTHDLTNRVKELNCLYAISRFMEKRDTTLDTILQGIADLIPSAWQHPEITCARIIMDGQVFKTKNFRHNSCKLTSDIIVHGGKRGILEVCCLKEKNQKGESPFLKEEENLLNMIAERLGKIIERKRAEDETRGLKKQIEFILGATKTGLVIINTDFKILYIDPEWQERYGDPKNKRCYEYFMERNDVCPNCGVFQALEKKEIVVHEEFLVKEANRPIQVTSIPFQGDKGEWLVAEINVDITERKRAEEKIKQSLKEKEVLLREIHHRVKNNLQIISSLLKLQASRVNDKHVKKVYQESNNRINAMALVHEILYQSEDLAEIDLKQYIIYIARNLLKIFGSRSKDVTLETEGDDVHLEINQAVPIGLILNEIISNSLKHAFPEGHRGEVKIFTHLLEGGRIELIVSDNGQGIPNHIDYRNTKTLGLRLIHGLVEKQLKGTLALSRSNGTQYTIQFERKV